MASLAWPWDPMEPTEREAECSICDADQMHNVWNIQDCPYRTPHDEPLREEGPVASTPSPHQAGAQDGGQQDTPLDPPPSSLSGHCKGCDQDARAGFLCPRCGTPVPVPDRTGQSNWIPY